MPLSSFLTTCTGAICLQYVLTFGILLTGTTKRAGVQKPHDKYFPEPVLIPSLVTEKVTGIACGPSHTVCTTLTGVFSWGAGSGYRLGHGDTRDRSSPSRIEEFNGIPVKQVSCGTWHSAVLSIVPPFQKSGWVRGLSCPSE